ncbi:MAG: DegT/DnrJ/EryC1/StrS family aminotransferase [Bacteriovoracaceae bacterium]|nr:DegT/DnrJ/EryC1/StrS family aminotransferase [Bacteriovoracaceae bacterium]
MGVFIRIRQIPRAVYYMSWWTPFLTILKTLLSIDLGSSKSVAKFEEVLGETLGRPVHCLPNARYCLKLTLDYLNVGTGSTVLMTPINLPDMKTIISNTGANLTFIDFKENSFEPDLDDFTPPKNALVFFLTPLAGIPVDMEKVFNFCKSHNLSLILDLTQCYLTKWKGKRLFEYSDFAFSSMCDLKVIHTHRGAYYITENKDLQRHILEKSTNELKKIERKFLMISAFEDWVSLTLLNPYVFYFFTRFLVKLLVVKRGDNVEAITSGQGIKFLGFRFLKGFFQSNQVKENVGFPSFLLYRFTDLQAKIGLKRMPHLIEIEERRIRNAKRFYNALNIKARESIPRGIDFDGATFWKTPIWIENPNDFKERARKWGIDCSQTNLPQLNGAKVGSTQNMRDNIIYMPTHWYLMPKDIDEMAKFVNDYFSGKS